LTSYVPILNVPESYNYNDFRKNVLLVAQRELELKAKLLIDWRPIRKDGKRILTLEFAIKTARQLAQEAVELDRQQISNMPLHEAVATAWRLMANYKLKAWQKDRIASDYGMLETFFRVDAELANGLRTDIRNPTAYLIKSLGLDKETAPKPVRKNARATPANAPTLPLDSTARTADTHALATLIAGMNL